MDITIDGKKYEILNDDIVEGDLMLVNNPHPKSDIKNWVRKCNVIRTYEHELVYSWFIVTDEERQLGHHSHMYPKSMCKKIIEI